MMNRRFVNSRNIRQRFVQSSKAWTMSEGPIVSSVNVFTQSDALDGETLSKLICQVISHTI